MGKRCVDCFKPAGRGLAAVLLLSLLACVTIPIQEMSDARQAINSAEAAAAAQWAPNSLMSAQKLLLVAEQALADENYTHARETAAAARSQALQARRLAASFEVVSGLLDDAERIGAEQSSARLLFDRAADTSRMGDEQQAAVLIVQADGAITASLERSYRQQATGFIDAVASQSRGLNLPQQSSLQAARTALSRGELERAYELSRNLAGEFGIVAGGGG